MGNCASCLGGARKDDYDEDEAQRLLFEDTAGYGSFPDPNMANQDDAIETQRQTEALHRVVSKTSENMVDIFEIAPQIDGARPVPAQLSYAGHEARIVRYQTLINKLNLASNEDANDGVQIEWLPQEEDGNIEMHRGVGDKPDDKPDDKPLVGTFADAAAAMG